MSRMYKKLFLLVFFFLASFQFCSDNRIFNSPPFKNFKLEYAELQMNANESKSFHFNTGTVVDVPENAFVDANGKPVEGEVKIFCHEYHDPANIITSGIPMTCDSLGKVLPFESGGMFEIQAEHNGEPVFISKDKKIKIDFASYTADNDYNLYYFEDETPKKKAGISFITSVFADNRNNRSGWQIIKKTEVQKNTNTRKTFKLQYDTVAFPELAVLKNYQWDLSNTVDSASNPNASANKWVLDAKWQNVSIANASCDFKKALSKNVSFEIKYCCVFPDQTRFLIGDEKHFEIYDMEGNFETDSKTLGIKLDNISDIQISQDKESLIVSNNTYINYNNPKKEKNYPIRTYNNPSYSEKTPSTPELTKVVINERYTILYFSFKTPQTICIPNTFYLKSSNGGFRSEFKKAEKISTCKDKEQNMVKDFVLYFDKFVGEYTRTFDFLDPKIKGKNHLDWGITGIDLSKKSNRVMNEEQQQQYILINSIVTKLKKMNHGKLPVAKRDSATNKIDEIITILDKKPKSDIGANYDIGVYANGKTIYLVNKNVDNITNYQYANDITNMYVIQDRKSLLVQSKNGFSFLDIVKNKENKYSLSISNKTKKFNTIVISRDTLNFINNLKNISKQTLARFYNSIKEDENNRQLKEAEYVRSFSINKSLRAESS